MTATWICYKFPTSKSAHNFVADIADGYRTMGSRYVTKWERPKRKKGGYWVAVLPANDAKPFDELAGFYSGQRLERK